MKAIGDRMKLNYEQRHKHLLTKRMPVIVRVDGKAFHTFTRRAKCRKPFCDWLMNSMVTAAMRLAKEMQGFKAAYVQSDEASFFMADYDTFATCGWFDYEQNKIESISASIMTSAFNRAFNSSVDSGIDANFDARAFNVPREEVANYFLWRALDWERNSVAMYCNSVCSHREMHGKGRADQHEMLHAKGMNWTTDLTARQRNGTWLISQKETSDLRMTSEIQPKYDMIAASLDPLINCDK